jgi:hypothetical protein
MATVIEQPPQPKPGLGCCLGKGCLILVCLFIFLLLALVCGAYFGLQTFTSTEPRELPQVETSEEKQQEVSQRWHNFENSVREYKANSGVADVNPQPPPSQTTTTVPNEPAAKPRIELTAGDINQMISANRHSRGKAFVSIADGVGHVSVSIPTPRKARLGERYLNADFEVRSAPNGDVSGIRISLQGARWLSSLLGGRSIRGWVDPYINQYRGDYDVSSFKIVGDRVVLEAGRGRK